ncbi:MAG: hypothetical protein IJ661_01000 [Lachnospiraceae bacterium]|nr:hypothetical protein [Lachnospiraceae bacterium]
MSNLIKSGFVSFTDSDIVKIDANENKIIKGIDSAIEEARAESEAVIGSSVEEAIAEAMVDEAELEGLELSDAGSMLTMDTSGLPMPEGVSEEDASASAQDIINSANNEAQKIINNAHDEAEKLRGEAYEEARSIREQAKEEGYQEGYNEGANAASQEYEEKNKELDNRISEFENEMEAGKEELIKEATNRMTDWLMQMVPHITGVSIDGAHNVLLYMINNAMRDLDNSRHFIIKVSPDDYNDVLEKKNEIYGALNPGIDMEIFEDSKLSKLQCMIETDNGIVDISLDAQLDNLIKALKLLKTD